MRLLHRLFVLLIDMAWLDGLVTPANSQTTPNLDEFAMHVAGIAGLAHPQTVLVAPLDGCMLENQLCIAFETAFKNHLQTIQPSVQFMGREDNSRQLTDDQFPVAVFGVGLMNGMSLS
jgi:hypothetical protein